MIHYHAGIDCFTPPAGTVDKKNCAACHSEMQVERNILSSSGKYGHPVPGRLEDIFTCQYSATAWHRQVIALLQERDKTASKKIDDLLAEEIQQILITRQPTKCS